MIEAASDKHLVHRDYNGKVTLKIVPEACQLDPGGGGGTVAVESCLRLSEAIDSLDTMAAKNLALAYAGAQGVSGPMISGTPRTIGVNANGVPYDKIRGEDGEVLPATHPHTRIEAYRLYVPVTQKL